MRSRCAALMLLLVGCREANDDARVAPALSVTSVTSDLCSPTLPTPPFAYADADAPIPRSLLESTAGTVMFTDNTPPTNRATNAGAMLGRVLFFDRRMSANDRVACASCHRQAFGFGDTARVGRGVHGKRARRTMALANARFYAYGRFFWDERAATLEAQVLQPIQGAEEMGMTVDTLVAKLQAIPYYPALFAGAFGSPRVTRDGVAAALAQFVRSLTSGSSRFDAAFSTGGAPDLSRLSPHERDGFRLFVRVGCINCHRTAAQIPDQASNIGLDDVSPDTGAGGGRFKPPSLRNVAVRPPYMHDGRFASLREVVDFYATAVRNAPGLDPRLRGADGQPRRLHLDSHQRDDLVAFLESLTDTAFLHADRFSDPFRCRDR